MVNNQTGKKYSYMLAFVFGMAIMVIFYIIFDATTNAEYRVRTSGDVDISNIVYTSGKPEDAGTAASAFFGIEGMSVNPVIGKQLNIDTQKGVLVNTVLQGSPASGAGLRRGDVIVGFDNQAVSSVDSIKDIMAGLEPGDRVRISYIRNGGKDTAYVVLAEPAGLQGMQTTAIDTDPADWGLSLAPLNSSLRQSYGIPGDVNGVMVLSVEPGALADESGLRQGDVITGIDKAIITDMDEFFKAIISDKNNTALLSIYSQGAMRYIPLDSSGLKVTADQEQSQTTLRQKIFSVFTGGMPFADDDEEEGPKGGKFTDDNIALASDNAAFNRPSTVVGDTNTGGTTGSSPAVTGMNRPSLVPPQIGGPDNDIVLFVGLLLLVILYLGYREFNRPPELKE